MAREAFCTTCQRTVYIGDGDSGSCPVCSSPLLDGSSQTPVRPADALPGTEVARGHGSSDHTDQAEVLILE